jgi:hypothetical protein
MARRRSLLREWAPVIAGVTILAMVVAGVAALVSAQQPTVGLAEDVAVFSPPLTGRKNDLLSGEIRREAGCTYLDADDGRRWIPLFPDLGTRWDGDSLRVEGNRYFLEGTTHLRGEIVKLPVDGHDADIPAGCRDTGLYFMVKI